MWIHVQILVKPICTCPFILNHHLIISPIRCLSKLIFLGKSWNCAVLWKFGKLHIMIPLLMEFFVPLLNTLIVVGICAYVLWWSSCLDALLFHFFYIDPNFGLTTKAKAWQWEHVIRRMFQDLSTLPQVWESESQSAFSCWELESCGALVYVFFNDTRLVLLWRIPPFIHTRLVWIWI